MTVLAVEPLNQRALERYSPTGWLKATEAARRLRVHHSTVYRWLARGSFPVRAFKVGGRWWIDAEGLDEWITNQGAPP